MSSANETPNSSIVTLTSHVLESQQHAGTEATGDLTLLLTAIQTTCKFIATNGKRASLLNLIGAAGTANVQGEDQKKLDILSNEIMINSLRASGKTTVLISEENDDPIFIDTAHRGKYCVVFDPLDGSSNIDAGVNIGTIFGVYKVTDGSVGSLADVLRPGKEMVAAGYCMYGSSANLVISTGNGVNGYTLDNGIGEFILTHPNIRIPSRGKIYSFNEGNSLFFHEPVTKYLESIKYPTNGKPYSARYIGSMVADVHRTLLYGGIFGYPEDKKSKTGKLRLLYEGFPMAFLTEQAGGVATTGRERILDIVPTGIHQRIPVFLGSAEDVQDVLSFYAEAPRKRQRRDHQGQPRLRIPHDRDDDEPDPAAAARRRHNRILSPLPVNHSISRSATRARKRKRVELVRDVDDVESDASDESDAAAVVVPMRRLRSADQVVHEEEEPDEDEDGEEGEDEDDESEGAGSDEATTEGDDGEASDEDEPLPPPVRSTRGRSQSLPSITARPPPLNRTRRSVAHILPAAARDEPSSSSSANAPAPRMIRTRSNQLADQEPQSRTLRNGKSVVLPPSVVPKSASPPNQPRRLVKFSECPRSVRMEHDDAHSPDATHVGPSSPVARRTRHGSASASLSPKASSTRPQRLAKVKASAKFSSSAKGKAKALDQDAVASDDEIEMEEEEVLDEDEAMEEDQADEEPEEEEERPSRGARRGSHPTGPRRRTRRSHQEIEAPASDADEESPADDEEEPSDAEEDEASDGEMIVASQLRPARQLRNGKVVLLRPAMQIDQDEGSEEDAMSDDQVDEDAEEEAEETEVEVDLAHATSKSLLRCRRYDLVRLCEERDLDGEGTKKELVHALLQWRDHDSGSGDDTTSGSATASGDSAATARAETKTQALDRTKHSLTSSTEVPLLMRKHHTASAAKPRTAANSKADEQEEVNALDLESLHLQDKEIPPEKLTKLEKVGSGGFKDVYKGLYRKQTIAIADIRGHLTDMDIKELGLLRDLRHTNIVTFIGVSIPKEPNSVPVMIVTELCSNGDLFDYIRGVEHPPFLQMLEIMLGIARGVEYLHTRTPAIIHRDIKSSNVLITDKGVAKINDFGLARVKTSTRSVIRSLVGTVNWQAPELWVPHPRYNEKVDVYSVALVFWEILQWHQPVKRYPFESMNEHAIYDAVGHKNLRPPTASLSRTWGLDILELVQAGWNGDQAARPSMAEMVLRLEVMVNQEKEKIGVAGKEKRSRR
ncbi:mitogen-activated protein kinase kinase kinase 13 [Pseudohyphozyma bogoriensis]|nr:mitogen-activated protein kinase kinase kinase 13 [Pseudohyphozyma bogoriensis]